LRVNTNNFFFGDKWPEKARNIPVLPDPYPNPNVICATRPDPNPNIICATRPEGQARPRADLYAKVFRVVSFRAGFLSTILYVFLISPIRIMCSTYLILLDLILIICSSV
jgi:hypothetical protein